MTLFLDTEFTGLRQSAQLISLALVDLEGRWFYAEFTDYDETSLTNWHQEHVIANLFLQNGATPIFTEQEGLSINDDSGTIVRELEKWLSHYDKVEIWADVPAYDWVLFCELFGGALSLPKSIYYICFDFATLLKTKGFDADIPRETLAPNWSNKHKGFKHNSLYDAFLLRNAYRALSPA